MRKYYIDYLRAIATVLVIVIHVSCKWFHEESIMSPNWITSTFFIAVAKISVPVFFMISGALFLDSNKELQVKKLYRINILRLVVFLLFWNTIYQIYMNFEVYRNQSIIKTIVDIIKKICMGDSFVHLWYIYAIIGLYIVAPILKVFTDGATKRQLLYAIVVCFVFTSLYDWLNLCECFSCLKINLGKIRYNFTFGYIIYFFIGHYIDKYEILIKRYRLVILAGVLSILIMIASVFVDSIRIGFFSERMWDYLLPTVLLPSVGFFMIIKKRYNSEADGLLKKHMMVLSKRSLGIYGSHYLFVMLIQLLPIWEKISYSILIIPIQVLIVLVVAWGTSFVLAKIPYVGKYIA